MKRRVALLIETSSAYGRDLLSGVLRFMRTHDEWSVFLEQRDLWKKPPGWLTDWQGDGIISRATTPALLEAVRRNTVPLVDTTDRHGETTVPAVRSDDAAIGRMAAEHLLDRGYQHFGFCGFKGEAWSVRREQAFVEVIRSRNGADCRIFNSRWHGPLAQPWEVEQDDLLHWLRQFDAPFAVMGCNDVRGQQIIDACSKLELSVPEQAAVLGVDNDDLLCRICSPPLSSVIPNATLVGYRAAETLSNLMQGIDVGCQPQLIKPLDVAIRQSTDVVAIGDRRIAAAVGFIRQHACRGLSVEEVVRHAAISRSTLERQFRSYFQRTPQQEIRRVQVKRAKELLISSELPAERIAIRCGFEHPEYFYVVFKRLVGCTPCKFRQQRKPKASPEGDKI